MRQIVLDTETTGREPAEGHRIIEIGCLELVHRRLTGKHFHHYLNPDRESEAGALAVHGLTQEFLADKPAFNSIVENFLAFISGTQLIIHNAPFDVSFLNSELKRAGKQYGQITDHCTVLDTLPLARQMHPGQRNSLDALCKRYGVDNSQRDLHGALLDAELLAKVYLIMTGGQTNLFAEETKTAAVQQVARQINPVNQKIISLPVILANEQELADHQERLAAINKASKGACVWSKVDS